MYIEILNEVIERKRILGMKTDEHIDTHIFGVDQKSPIFFQKLMDKIFDFERTRNCIVYAAIYNEFKEIGNHLTLLYVSYENQDEWEAEKEDLKAMEPIAYVVNLTYPELSEYGTVVLRSHDGVLERIG